MKSTGKHLICLLLTILMLASSLPMTANTSIDFSAFRLFANAASDYNATAAVVYAYKHWNDGVGLCAEFVSKCLNEGGVNIPNKASYYSSSKQSYNNNSGTLGSYTNPYTCSASQLVYLSECGYEVISNPSNSQFSVGDVAFMYSKSNGVLKWKDGHVGIIVKIENGIPYYAAHNRAQSSGSFSTSYPCTYLVKMKGTSVSHTRDTNYDTNFTAYLKNPGNNHYVFNQNHGNTGGYVNGSDPCTIIEVYTDGCCQFSYLTDSGKTKTAYGKIEWFNASPKPKNYVFDVNVHLDGVAYDGGHSSTTFDVYINGALSADDVTDFCSTFPEGTSYTVTDIRVGGTYVYNGDSSYSGSLNGDVAIILPISNAMETLGDDFWAYIIKRNSWKHLERSDSNVQLSSSNDSFNPKQIWHFLRQGDGSYVIKNAYDDKCLDIADSGANNNTNVQVYAENGTSAQRFYLVKEGSDYNIQSVYCDKVLDVNNNSDEGGTNIQLYEKNYSSAQRFIIYKVEYDGITYSKPDRPAACSMSIKKTGYRGYAGRFSMDGITFERSEQRQSFV